MLVSSANAFKWKCFVLAKQMFAFWPVGTNQQMLLLAFPQADWHLALPSVRFPFRQQLSRDAAGCLVGRFVKAVVWLRGSTLPNRSPWSGVSEDLCPPRRAWGVSCGAVRAELASSELDARCVVLMFHQNLCRWRAVVCRGLAQGIH